MGLLKKVYAVAIFFLIVGGMAWGYMGMMGKNLVSEAFGKRAPIIYGIVGLSAVLVLAVGRNAFYPFLGPTVFPCAALSDSEPENADTQVQLQVRPGAKVLYWGAEPSNAGLMALKSWKDAYAGYQNIGVATADELGMVVLRLRKPQPYKVPIKGRLESHVHYRMCLKDGWMSQVETHLLSSEPIVTKKVKKVESIQRHPKPPITAATLATLVTAATASTAATAATTPVTVTATAAKPKPPVIPSIQNPEMPVVADPISGLPTAVPKFAVEGFSSEPLYSTCSGSDDKYSPITMLESADPRLNRLHSLVERDAIAIADEMAHDDSMGIGTDLNAAFQSSIKGH